MATPRRHPSRYDPWCSRAYRHGPRMECKDLAAARRKRRALYAFREAMRAHPDWNPDLLALANTTRIHMDGRVLTFTRN